MSGFYDMLVSLAGDDMGRQDQRVIGSLQRIERKLDSLLSAVQSEENRQEMIMAELDNLIAAVERNTTVDESAVTLLQGLTDKIAALAAQGGSVDAARIQELADALQASTDRLSNAISANTPAETG